jgi:integrase/recombinase XerD
MTLSIRCSDQGGVMVDLSKTRVRGPLEPVVAGFAAGLVAQGYTLFSTRNQMALAAHLSRWLAGQGLEVSALTASVVEGFLAARRAAGYRAFRTAKALAPLLGYLRGLQLLPPGPPAGPRTPAEVLLDRFGEYLLAERGLRVEVVRGYRALVGPFVMDAVESGGGGPVNLTAADVTTFMVASSGRLAPKTVQRLASALRSLLRLWLLDGVVAVSLVEAVPKVAHRPAHLPRSLEPVKVAAILASCDTSSRNGLRDRAILLMLSRLGLRAGEVARLGLDDVDWRAGLITVRGKGNRTDALPLPPDLGQAIVDYLQSGRPTDAAGRSVFVRVLAPHRALTGSGVTQVVAAARLRAGLGETVYAHRLRHSAATTMLAAGAPLAEIGQVLRHRRPLTTAGYTRVDIEALRALARPWPGVS